MTIYLSVNGGASQTITASPNTVTVGSFSSQLTLNAGDIISIQYSSTNSNTFTAFALTIVLLP
jgi:hypothetical protein